MMLDGGSHRWALSSLEHRLDWGKEAKYGKTILCQILKRDRKGPEGRQQLRQLWLRNQA